MRTKVLSLLALILLIVARTVSAQDKVAPNLSGTWKMNPAKSKLPKASKIQSETVTIKQDGLQIEFHFDTDGSQFVHSYTADKKEKVIREVPQAGGKILEKAYWKGAALVTESKIVFNASSPIGEMMPTKDSWTVSSDGLVLTEKSQSEEGQSETVYDKQ
jgi:hypothetical protein